MKHFILGVITTLVVLVAGLFFYLRMGFAEVRTDVPAPRWESALMSGAVHASVRRHAPEMRNPVEPTDQNLIAGGTSFLGECSGCHGTPGKPDDDTSDSLYPPVPQFGKVGTQYTEAQVFWVAKHGIRHSGMFANGKWDPDEKLWTIAAYIKRMGALPPAVKEGLQQKPPDAVGSKDSGKS